MLCKLNFSQIISLLEHKIYVCVLQERSSKYVHGNLYSQDDKNSQFDFKNLRQEMSMNIPIKATTSLD